VAILFRPLGADLRGGSDAAFNFRFLFGDILGKMILHCLNIEITYEGIGKDEAGEGNLSPTFNRTAKKKVQTL
jgi:hypothetical protein